MTEQPEVSDVSATIQTSSTTSPVAPRAPVSGYVAVACVALAIGAGSTFVALRGIRFPWQTIASPSTATPLAQAHDMSSMSGMSGMSDTVGMADMPGMSGTPVMPGMPGMEADPAPESDAVYVSPARQQLIGVRTMTVARQNVTEAITAVGSLAYDESRVTQVHTKIAGWIDRLFVDFVGKAVQKGQPLFSIYSPDLVATQSEYLLARRAQEQMGASRFEETRRGAASLLAASRTRLTLWDISDAQIAELERTGEPQKTLTLYAPSAGVVLERNVLSGQYVTPETAAFKLVDLSTLWAIGQVAEAEAARVRIGQPVAIDRPNTPGARSLVGHITFIYPDVDPVTRRVRVRAEVSNPGLTLKPEAFVTLTIKGVSTSSVAVPAEAVIDTGAKRYVILALANGYFEPREIRAGTSANGYYPIVSGLVVGDRVVTSAQFLIDSETNLQAAMQAMANMPGMDMGPKAATRGGR